ncbi:MAG: RDD family protein [Actinomycetia bacterium]|nr:RDD family protein [Actinomycetes bacterium]
MTSVPPAPDRAGWFDDPDDAEQLRYFDGIIWTDHTTPRRTVWARKEPAQDAAVAEAPTGSGLPSLYAPHQPPGQPRQDQQNPYAAQHYSRQGQQPGPTTPDGVPLATMSSRLGAWAIDVALTWAVGLVLGGFFFWRGLGNYPEIIAEAVRSGASPGEASALAQRVQFDLPWMGAFALVQLLVGVGYHTYFLSRTGATLGKRAAGISVRLEERAGVLTPTDAMRRSLLRPVLFMFISTPALSLLAMPLSIFDALAGLWHPKRQTLHDRIGRTVVVQGPQPRVSREDRRENRESSAR